MKSQPNHQSGRKRTPIAAFELTAIPVVSEKEQSIMDCVKTILRKSHSMFDFAVEILSLGCKNSQRVNGSYGRIIITIFACGKGQYGSKWLDALDMRTDLLRENLKEQNYAFRKLNPEQWRKIHVRLQELQQKNMNILAPRRGMTDAGNQPVCTLAKEIAADTAVSLLFTRDSNEECCRVTCVVQADTREKLLVAKACLPTWVMLDLKNKNRDYGYLRNRVGEALNLNKIKSINKTIPWEVSLRLMQLPIGADYGMPCADPQSIGIKFPVGMLDMDGQPHDTIRIGYTTGTEGKVAVSLTKEQLSRHCAVLGQTGSGKSTLLCELISNCALVNICVLVFDLAGSMEFRGILQAIGGDIYTIKQDTAPYAINPLNIEGFSPKAVKSILSDFFEKYLGLFEPLPRVVKEVFNVLPERTYTVPEFISGFMDTFDKIVGYSSDVKTDLRSAMEVRLASLANVFGNACEPLKPETFFQTNVLLETHGCTEIERTILLAFLLEVMLKYVQEKRNRESHYQPVVIIIDEVHTLLDSSKNDDSRACLLRLFRRLIAEGRKLGLWFIVADQRLDLIRDIMEEVGTKFLLHTDTACTDLAELLREPYAEKHLPILAPGELYCRAPGMSKAVFVRIPTSSNSKKKVINANVVRTYMKEKGKLMPEPLPCPIHQATVPATPKSEALGTEDETRRIAYKDVLIKVIEYMYKSGNTDLPAKFSLEQYLENTSLHLTDPQAIAKVRFYLTEAVRNLQMLI